MRRRRARDRGTQSYPTLIERLPRGPAVCAAAPPARRAPRALALVSAHLMPLLPPGETRACGNSGLTLGCTLGEGGSDKRSVRWLWGHSTAVGASNTKWQWKAFPSKGGQLACGARSFKGCAVSRDAGMADRWSATQSTCGQNVWRNVTRAFSTACAPALGRQRPHPVRVLVQQVWTTGGKRSAAARGTCHGAARRRRQATPCRAPAGGAGMLWLAPLQRSVFKGSGRGAGRTWARTRSCARARAGRPSSPAGPRKRGQRARK
ncbi:MAG: hypothetical protein J3K34DRAFT_259673 [Monoraphidium minutum]|nr:MAG: hypothetical protein J3K34DRAFT_259673 [Monoraphidium minutum]